MIRTLEDVKKDIIEMEIRIDELVESISSNDNLLPVHIVVAGQEITQLVERKMKYEKEYEEMSI